MDGYCGSCGGMLGRDCFNPQECAEITQRMSYEAERSSAYEDGFAAGQVALISQNEALLEALKKMVHAATYGTFNHADSHPIPMARAAIAKATGAA